MYPASLPGIMRLTATVTVLAFVTLCQLDASSAKSLGISDGSWQSDRDIAKRNSWWSKKSLDSRPRYKDLTDSGYRDYTDVTDESAQPEVMSSYDCYSEACLPVFLSCMLHADDVTSILRCKTRLQLCTATCLVISPRDVNNK